ncbi:hypothetical protein [Pseudomonas baetica]|uniref:hypothetical protein n=1 Tax=Pseudomonas baetica TaxID=674054 RepID=UPI00240694EB|nr:hypothetical protein [Pseudomonas baetica]MDF9773696.1 hypothetical protein [Pseudomonas baetica]
MVQLEDDCERTADEAKVHLLECLAYGKEALLFGPPCEGFDFSGNDWPGHDNPQSAVNTDDLVSIEIAG